jgi:acylphosphatase
MIRAHLKIYGRVQGVGFRSNTRRQARRLGIKGWVKNLQDGSVEVVAQGLGENIDELISWCHRGPPTANVSKVEVEKTEVEEEFQDFKIIR